MAIGLMICIGRSGGTLLNQCLGALDNVVMLSEVHPLGGGWGVLGPDSYTTPKAQAKNWYNIELTARDYWDSILELEEYCEKNGKHLILREWTYLNFVPHAYNLEKPSKRMQALETLQKFTKVNAFAFVRDSIDVWISFGMLEPKPFFQQYLDFAKEIVANKMEVFKYEDFCENPEGEIRKMCALMDIPFSESYKNFNDFEKVNGDIQLQGNNTSRGRVKKEIGPLPRKVISEDKIKLIEKEPNMRKVNQMFDYPTTYSKKGNIIQNVKDWLAII